MKKYKFRVWDEKLKEMHYLDLEDLGTDDYWFDGETNVWSVLNDCNTTQKRFVLMHWTGLYDLEKNEVYEGDLLECGDRIVGVYWNRTNAMYDSKFIKYIEKEEFCGVGITASEWKFRAIIIGNIHENPELLEAN